MNEESIFADAIEQPTREERAAFLDRACEGQSDLRARVEALLEAHQNPDRFLDEPVVHSLASTDGSPARVGNTIGPYKLLEEIGEGGFGIVFMAEQSHPVRRKVALKLVKPGMDTRHVIARFEAERQALALMDHPHIARVFEAGATDSGHPFFVMELVRGIPITQFCDQSRYTPRQRLELFVSLCNAIQHAHQKGIIHRDIKPSNVLVTLHDGVPVVKVIDFGIAKALDQRLTDKTLFTSFAQMLGSPLYMSPEQAEMSGLDVDMRSDVYSLGVLLYELLTGTTPFEKARLTQVSFDEMRRILREEEPPRPSTRLSTLGLAATTVSANRQSELPRLNRLLRGELDWIVMKALEKDRTRRYESASALAADVQRHLWNEPVLACPPSTWYRLQKFALHNQAVLTTMASLAAVLVLGTVSSTWFGIRAYHAEKLAKHGLQAEQFARVEADAAKLRAEQQRRHAEENFVNSINAAEEMLVTVSESDVTRLPQGQSLRRDLLIKAKQFFQRLIQPNPTDPSARFQNGKAFLGLSNVYFILGELEQASDSNRAALELFQELVREFPAESRYRSELITTHRTAGVIKSKMNGTQRESIWHCEQAVNLLEELDIDRDRHELAIALHALAYMLASASDFAQAEHNYRRAIDVFQSKVPPSLDEQFSLAAYHNSLGLLMRKNGRADEAELAHRKALEILRELEPAYGNEDSKLQFYQIEFLRTLLHLYLALQQLEKPEECLALSREGLTIAAQRAAAFPLRSATVYELGLWHDKIAQSLVKDGGIGEAEEHYRRALESFDRCLRDFPYDTYIHQEQMWTLFRFGQYLSVHGRQDEASDIAEQLFSLEPTDPRSLNSLAWHLVTTSDARFRHAHRAIQLAEQAVEQSPQDGEFWTTLGVAHYRAGRWNESIAALNKSMQLLDGKFESSNTFFLAMASWQAGQKEVAEHWYARAVQWMENNSRYDLVLKRFRAEAEELIGEKPKVADP